MSYDNIAWMYDRLSRVVFGNSIRQANGFLASQVAEGSRVLVVGGGTGLILEQMAATHHQPLSITFVDSSLKMIERARQRRAGEHRVTFVTKAIQHFETSERFDAIITPFLFDNFSEANAYFVFRQLVSKLSPNGTWHYADFQVVPGQRIWQQPLLRVMYLFFRMTCGIEAGKLPDMEPAFKESGFQKVRERAFFRQFIKASVYSRMAPDQVKNCL